MRRDDVHRREHGGEWGTLAVVLACMLAARSGLSYPPPRAGDTRAVLHVDDDAPPGGDGLTWETAFDDLQDALAAAGDGWTIRIGGGVYRPGGNTESRFATFWLKPGLTLAGGYAGYGAPDPNLRDIELHETILSGDLNGDDEPGFVNRADNVYHVVTADGFAETALLDGLTITGGWADAPDILGLLPYRSGAGVFVYQASVLVDRCTFRGNMALNGGGGICAMEGGLALDGCSFDGNEAGMGAGVFSASGDLVVIDCAFTGNDGGTGAGIVSINGEPLIVDCLFADNHAIGGPAALDNAPGSSATVLDCLFADNTAAGGAGGAVGNYGPSTPTFDGCVFLGNFSSDEGGAMMNYNADVTVVDCIFAGNSAAYGGGAADVQSTGNVFRYTNCVFSGNTASVEGGGFLAGHDGDDLVANCTFTGNSAGYGGAIRTWSPHQTHTFSNCTIWGNSAIYEDDQISGDAVVTYSLVEGGWSGLGHHNIDGDPRFIDADGPDGIIGTIDDDLRLLPASPCIDAADNAVLPPEIVTDLDGNDRFVDDPTTPDTGAGIPPIVDMGAYEYRHGDINRDGVVNVLDLLAVLAAWGAAGGPEDLNADGIVDVLDLLSLLANWT